MTRGLVAGALAAVLLVACAMGGSKRSAAPMAVAPHSDAAMVEPMGDPRSEIEKLDRQMVAERAKLGFELPPAPSITSCETCPQPMTTKPLTSTDPACKHGASETCTDVCILSDSICETAGKICKLADQMAGDQWAADKCINGKLSCTEANAKCCDCK